MREEHRQQVYSFGMCVEGVDVLPDVELRLTLRSSGPPNGCAARVGWAELCEAQHSSNQIH